MAEGVAGKFAPMIRHICIDVVGQVSELKFICLLLAFHHTRFALLSGDPRQLGHYDVNIPTPVKDYGHKSLIDIVTNVRRPTTVTLRKVYRSEEFITKAIVKPLYVNEVENGLKPGARQLAATLPRDSANKKSVMFIQTSVDGHKPATTTSWTNDMHTDIAVRVAKAVHRYKRDARIVVLSYYAQQRYDIQAKLRGTTIESHTITSYQGREAEVVILVTTRGSKAVNCNGDAPVPDAKALEFIHDPHRTTVGLTRAQEMLFIVGDDRILYNRVGFFIL